MAVKKQVSYIAACDVCGAEFDEANGFWHWDETRLLALDQLAEDPDWTEVEGGVVCPVSDQAHDDARGAESPVALRATRDAMTVTHPREAA
jgi:rubredoxin